MIEALRIMLGEDKPYDNVKIATLSDELKSELAEKVLGDKAIMFSHGTQRQHRWIFTHAKSVTYIMMPWSGRPPGNIVTVNSFERIVLGGIGFGDGRILSTEEYVDSKVPQELLDMKIFDNPVVFAVRDGLCITNAETVTSIESIAGAPRPKSESELVDQAPITPINHTSVDHPVNQFAPTSDQSSNSISTSRPNDPHTDLTSESQPDSSGLHSHQIDDMLKSDESVIKAISITTDVDTVGPIEQVLKTTPNVTKSSEERKKRDNKVKTTPNHPVPSAIDNSHDKIEP